MNEYSSDEQGNLVLTPNSSTASDNEANAGTQDASEGSSFLPPPLKIPPSRARKQLAARLAMKEKERQEEKEKAKAGSIENGNAELPSGGIFSPTEGRTSTPDTPAFTIGDKIHERGLHAQRQSTGLSGVSGTGPKNAMSPVRPDGGSSDEEDIGDDPWASLDAAAEAAADSKEESGSKPKHEGSWFGSSFVSPKQATISSSSQSSIWGRLTGESSRQDFGTGPGDMPATEDKSGSPLQKETGLHDEEGDGEEVVIGFAEAAAVSSDHATTANSEMKISPTKAVAEDNDSGSPASPQARPRGDNGNRGTMSRLFQSWQGDTSASSSVDKVEENEA